MPRRSPHDLGPAIEFGRIQKLRIYQITEDQLELIERGTPESAYLSFSLPLLSAAAAFLITLLTTRIDSDRTFSVFVIATIIGFLAGCVLLVLWFRTRRSAKSVTAAIRKQLPPEGEQESGDIVIADDG